MVMLDAFLAGDGSVEFLSERFTWRSFSCERDVSRESAGES